MKTKRKLRRCVRPAREDGFTFVEVLVALTLLGTLTLVAWAAVFTGGRTMERISTGIGRNAELLRIDAAVRSSAARILFPSWLDGSPSRLPGAAERAGSAGLSIPWLDGSRDKSLTLSVRGGALVIDDGIRPAAFPGVLDAQARVAPPTDGTAPALILTVRLTGVKPVRIIAPLGSVPFPLNGQ